MEINKVEVLTEAFQDFTKVVEKFQETYNSLQAKIDFLSNQLEQKNKQLEKEIKDGENIKNFLHNILENIYSGVLVIDNQANIIIFNREAENILELDKDNVLGLNYRSVFPLNASDNKSLLYTLATGKESHHRQKIIQTSSSPKTVEFSTSLIKNNEGKIIGAVEVFNDISELKILQEKISHIETLAALGEMAASVAHEIRNPLGGIGGFAGLLERKLDKDDPRRKLVKPIITGVTRLNNIVSDLLTFTRPQKLHTSPVELNLVLKEIVNFFKISINNYEKKCVINEEYWPDKLIINLDNQLFQQIIMNLLKNAFDALEENGQITIRTRTNIPQNLSNILDEEEKKELLQLFSYAEIDIEDNGKGIPDDVLPKLFNPFFTTKEDGNGLGLAICKKIIHLHKGDIHVESKINKGTRFTITLPLYETYE